MDDQPICDFCSSPDIHWRYRAADFQHDRLITALVLPITIVGPIEIERKDIDIHWGSKGDWAACNVCHALIEANNRAKLTRRSAKTMLKRHPEITMSLRDAIELIGPMHAQFWSNRVGPAMRHEPKS